MNETPKIISSFFALILLSIFGLACGGGGGASSSDSSVEKPEPLNLIRPDVDEGFTGTDEDYIFIDLTTTDSSGNYLVTRSSNLEIIESSVNNSYMTNVIVLKKVIAAGNSFTMGSSHETLSESNEAEHTVTFSSNFYMGVYEVTQRQWAYVTNTNPSKFENQVRPLETVSYEDLRGDDAVYSWPNSDEVDPNSFIGKLREKTGLRLDLPTEAEWEYVCKAGTGDRQDSSNNSYNSLTFSGNLEIESVSELSADLSELGIFFDNNPREFDVYKTTFAGMYLPNYWGFYDMHGNVWEWCNDIYEADLGSAPVTDPKGASSGDNRTLRGGYYAGSPENTRSASRTSSRPENSSEIFGFRLYLKGDLD
jgi:formylglycine-generating enzyme required for sulfatase activity